MLDVKLMRNSKDPEVVYASVSRVFNHLDPKKKGSLGLSAFKDFFKHLSMMMTCAHSHVDWETLSEAFSKQEDDDDPEF